MKETFLFFSIILLTEICFAQNVGIGTTNPQAKLDVSGDIAFRSTDITITTTYNYALDVNTVKQSNYKLKQPVLPPAGNFIINGITSAVDGRMITLTNRTGSSMEIYNEDVNASAANRIQTGTGSTVAVYNNGNVTLQYDAVDQRWSIKSMHYNSLDYFGGGGSGWSLTGNSGTTTSNFIGTTDNQPIRFKVNGVAAGIIHPSNFNTGLGNYSLSAITTGHINTAYGNDALRYISTGSYNTAIGASALRVNNADENTAIGFGALANNETGYQNTGVGAYSLTTNISGYGNTSIGYQSLAQSQNVHENTAVGTQSLYSLNSDQGIGNTAIGAFSMINSISTHQSTAVGAKTLYSNTTGSENTAIGWSSLNSNTTGEGNTAVGNATLAVNTSGSGNSAVGNLALINNIGSNNSALGNYALSSNTSGNENSAFGNVALSVNTIGNNNTSIGSQNLQSNTIGNNNTAVGYKALFNNTTGNWNTCVGDNSNTSTNNLLGSMALGTSAVTNANNKIVIGASSVPAIVIGGYAGWSNLSDGRFKENIKENVPGLDFINQLRPVTYTVNIDKLQRHITAQMPDSIATHYYANATAISQAQEIIRTGFVAQEVEATAKKLGYQFDGVNAPQNSTDNYSITYSQFVVPLVKAVQEQQHIIEELKKRIEKLEAK